MIRTLPPDVAPLAERVEVALGNPARLGVAFSGGVDSAVLLALAVRFLGADRTLAILGVSASLAEAERRSAHKVAAEIGVDLVELQTRELDSPEYRANGADRCFHCKSELFQRIDAEVLTRYGLSAVAYGENAEDVQRPDRPGSRAASEHGVLRPLAAAGLGKQEVRRIAEALGLSVADKPAAPCLASRIPHFDQVTAEKLHQVEAAEVVLRELGFREGRVRHHGDIARIELPPAELVRAVSPPVRDELLRRVRLAGFAFVSIDLAGIQSGAFTLPLVTK